MKTLADSLKRHTRPKEERPTRTYAERIRKLIRSPEQCKECGGEHPTRLCVKRFEKLQKPETTPLPMIDDDSTNSDTLCNHEESRDGETNSLVDLNESMTKLSLQPAKSVRFDLPESTPDTLLSDTDDSASEQSDEVENPISENNEADACLVRTAWLRKTSENVYMSNRKSISLRAYIHAAHRRTETPTLLDSGATENFMNLAY